MRVVFISNYLNHHQQPFCEAMYRLTDGNFKFIAQTVVSEWRKQLGYREALADYVVNCSQGDNRALAIKLINEADAVITDAEDLSLTQARYDAGKLTFRYSERLFKSHLRYLKFPIHWLKGWKTHKMYYLCSSAYTSSDYRQLGLFKGQMYKWGYFPAVRIYDNIDEIIDKKKKNVGLKPLDVSILWVGRLIGWKHPKVAIYVAKKLKEKGVRYELNIIGVGPLESELRKSIDNNNLSNNVNVLGAMSPEEVRNYMEMADIFLFTSDRNEGWGAVLNESMNSACAVVANKEIGSAPYLIEVGENGFTYSTIGELLNYVEWLVEHPEERESMGKNAYKTMLNTWNAETAAKNLIQLIGDLSHGNDTSIQYGPCSKA